MEKRLAEISGRKLELRSILETPEANLQEIQTELEALEQEQRSLEQKAELRNKLNTGEIKPTKEIEKPKVEERKIMEFTAENILESKEYRSAYLKTLQGVKLSEVEERAMTTASNSVGAIIPTQTMNLIVEKLKQASILYPLVTHLEIPSNLTIPVEGDNADYAELTEGDTNTDSADTVLPLSLTSHVMIKTVSITANVSAMAVDAFEAFVVTQLVKKFSALIDARILNGSGTGQAKGILTAVTPVTSATSGVIDYDDICDMFAGLKAAYSQGAVLVMNTNTLYKKIAKIKDDNKKPIFDITTGKLLGKNVIVFDAIADNKIVYGDFSQYYFNFTAPLTIESDKSVGFRSATTVYRGLALGDGAPALTEAFVVLAQKA